MVSCTVILLRATKKDFGKVVLSVAKWITHMSHECNVHRSFPGWGTFVVCNTALSLPVFLDSVSYEIKGFKKGMVNQ